MVDNGTVEQITPEELYRQAEGLAELALKLADALLEEKNAHLETRRKAFDRVMRLSEGISKSYITLGDVSDWLTLWAEELHSEQVAAMAKQQQENPDGQE